MPNPPDRDDETTEEDLKRRDDETNIPNEDTALETEGDPGLPPPASSGVS
jgi:hypothetical protein